MILLRHDRRLASPLECGTKLGRRSRGRLLNANARGHGCDCRKHEVAYVDDLRQPSEHADGRVRVHEHERFHAPANARCLQPLHR
ncbi:hypothetical protein D3C84_1139010 [compost metagenome]